MTLIVGLRCSDGIILASDSAASYAEGSVPTIGQQEVTKIQKLADGILYASTGAVGIAQVISADLTKMWEAKAFTKPENPAAAMMLIAKQIGTQIGPLLESAQRLVQLLGRQDAGATVIAKSLVGLAFKGHAHLFQFDYSGAPEEVTKELPFVALGSGQRIADPFLALLKRVLWKDKEPTLADGRFAAAWTIRHVVQTNVGGVGGRIQMASLSEGTLQIEFASADEHEQAVEEAEAALRDHVTRRGQPPVEAPPVPPH